MLARRSPYVRWRARASASCPSLTRSASRRISPSSFLGIRPRLAHLDLHVQLPALPDDREVELRADRDAGEVVPELGRVLEGVAVDGDHHVPGAQSCPLGGAPAEEL